MKESAYKDLLNEIARKDPQIHAMSEEESGRLKQTLYDMACDIDERCRKNGLRLFLVGGSLLGAVRHGGFIPWDDDMDFGMMRGDYRRLIEIFDQEFGDKYLLRCPNSPYPNGNRFMQIFAKDTVLVKAFERNPLQPDRVSIDVFPYDHVPDNGIARRSRGLRANFLMAVASCVMTEKYPDEATNAAMRSSSDGRRLYRLRSAIGKFFSFRTPEKWFDSVDNCIAREKPSKSVTSATGRKHYFGEIYQADDFVPMTELRFIDHMFYAPGKYENYLKGNYGDDYMTPPTEDKRESHFIVEFGG